MIAHLYFTDEQSFYVQTSIDNYTLYKYFSLKGYNIYLLQTFYLVITDILQWDSGTFFYLS